MAKKKTSHKKEAAPMAEPANDRTTTTNGRDATHETREAAPRDPSPDKTEKLKQLNDILLKQTKEKREQVSQLQSQVEEMGFEFSLTSETEREVMHVILSALVINLSIEISEKLRDLEAERQKEVERGVVLEEKVESLKEEVQSEIEKGRLVEKEKNVILGQLDMKDKEVVEMGKMVKDLEMVKSDIEMRFLKVCEEKEALVEKGREKEGVIRNLRNEKNEVETNLGESKKLVEKLKRKVEEEVKDKEVKVGQLDIKEKEVVEMGKMVKDLEMVKSDIEKRFLKVCEEKEALVEEGRVKEGVIRNLKNEKNEVETNLGESKKLVEKLKSKVEEEVKDKEVKVGLLKNEKEALEAKIVTLEQEQKLETHRLSLQTEALNQKNAEKEGEIRDLKATVDGKNDKILGLEKEIDILQLAIEEANKKGGFWSWIYPAATTILAAISFIYAARAR